MRCARILTTALRVRATSFFVARLPYFVADTTTPALQACPRPRAHLYKS